MGDSVAIADGAAAAVLNELAAAQKLDDGWRTIAELAGTVFPVAPGRTPRGNGPPRVTLAQRQTVRRALRELARQGLVETIMWKDLPSSRDPSEDEEDSFTVVVRLDPSLRAG